MELFGPGKEWIVGITDHITPPADIEQHGFPEATFVFLGDFRKDERWKEVWRRVDALLVWHWHVERETVSLLDRCKIVVRYGVGFDTIDLDALASRNIPLCNTPDYGTEEVADTACAMILALQRKLVAYDRAARRFEKGWQENVLHPQHRTSSCTVGLIGVGRIGTAVVNRLKPFGYTILGYDPYVPSGHEKAVGYLRVSHLEELLERSDIVSLHCPLTHDTMGMVDSAFISRMKPGACLVNTARGGIIESLDLIEAALREGHLAAAAFDVLPDEPPVEHSLLKAWREDHDWLSGRLIVNPHTAYYSEEGWYEMRFKAAETARIYLTEGRLRNHIQNGVFV